MELYNENNETQEVQQENYVKGLEENFEELQAAFLQLTSQFARLQFHIRQLKQATPTERDILINELDRLAFNNNENNNNDYDRISNDNLSCLERSNRSSGETKRKQHQLIQQLRNQIDHLRDIRTLIHKPLQIHQGSDNHSYISESSNASFRKATNSSSRSTKKSKSQC